MSLSLCARVSWLFLWLNLRKSTWWQCWQREIVFDEVKCRRPLTATISDLFSLCVCFSMCQSYVSVAFLCVPQYIKFWGPVSCKLSTPLQTTNYTLRWVLTSSLPLKWHFVCYIQCKYQSLLYNTLWCVDIGEGWECKCMLDYLYIGHGHLCLSTVYI